MAFRLVATVRQKRPGVWEVRDFTGKDVKSRTTQPSRTVHGSKGAAQRVADETDAAAGRGTPAGRTVADVLDAWVDQNALIWAPGSRRDYESRVRALKTDPIARLALARLTVADVARPAARAGTPGPDGSQPPHRPTRGVGTNGPMGVDRQQSASSARLRSSKVEPRRAMRLDDVQAVIAAAATVDLALRLAAVSGARRGELAALQWTDVSDGVLTIDSAVYTTDTSSRPEAVFIKAIRFLHDYTSQVDWTTDETAEADLRATNAFEDAEDAPRLRLLRAAAR